MRSLLPTFCSRAKALPFLVCLLLLVGCNPLTTTTTAPDICAGAFNFCLQGQAQVRMETVHGTILLEVDGEAAPVTAGNFIDLVRRGTYDGTVFHRVVREPVPFIVQGGDPISANPKTPKEQFGTGSFVDPDSGQVRTIPLEVKLKTESEPRYGRLTTSPSDLLQLQLSHERGALAMARSQAPDSASAQFYIALRPLPELDGRYAVFGRVIEGLEVVDAIQQDDLILRISAILTTPSPSV